MKAKVEILPLLTRLSEKKISREELNKLINLSTKIARLYLIKNYHKLSGIPSFSISTPEENALEAVSVLFCLDRDEENYNIINSLTTWSPPVTTESDAFYFLNKMTASRVEQYISETLKESDPVFGKIHNSLNYTIRKKGYARFEFAGCRYIVKTNKGGFEKNPITPEAFESIPAKCFMNKDDFLEEIFNYIVETLFFEPAIPVNMLVIRLKRLYTDARGDEAIDLLDKMIINETLKNAREEAERLIEQKYFNKGKITAKEKEFFIEAVNDILRDLRDGGLNPGLQKYLEKYMPDLKKRDDCDKYQNILEYLLKIMKKTIAGNLSD